MLFFSDQEEENLIETHKKNQEGKASREESPRRSKTKTFDFRRRTCTTANQAIFSRIKQKRKNIKENMCV